MQVVGEHWDGKGFGPLRGVFSGSEHTTYEHACNDDRHKGDDQDGHDAPDGAVGRIGLIAVDDVECLGGDIAVEVRDLQGDLVDTRFDIGVVRDGVGGRVAVAEVPFDLVLTGGIGGIEEEQSVGVDLGDGRGCRGDRCKLQWGDTFGIESGVVVQCLVRLILLCESCVIIPAPLYQ